jgi:plastocyanin
MGRATWQTNRGVVWYALVVSHVRLFLVTCLALTGLAVPGAVGAHVAVTQPLLATVGSPTAADAFQISLTDSTGAKLTHVDPGQYTINVHDYSTLHDFHLTGPGVDQATAIETASTATWNVTFTDGTYRYSCDAHPTSMRGSFTSGTVVTPPPVKKLVAQVGPKRTISLKNASGARVKSLAAGKYKITVKDLTKADNFHLIAPGVNRKTGVAFRGTSTWTVTFRVGAGKYRSDAHRALHGGFTVIATA